MNEGKRFVEAMEAADPRGPALKGTLLIQHMTACECGCGLPERVAITAMQPGTLHLTKADQVDALIWMLTNAREAIWGPRPPGGK